MESEFGVLRVNVTGSAIDADTDIKGVEISIDGLPFQLANPRMRLMIGRLGHIQTSLLKGHKSNSGKSNG